MEDEGKMSEEGEVGTMVKELRDEMLETERPWFGHIANLIERQQQ